MIASPVAEVFPVRLHKSKPELRALTSLRFLAALIVVGFHYSVIMFPSQRGVVFDLVGLGYIGVSFFFILSGFVLAYTYEGADFTDRGVRQNYLISRFARIYPNLLAALVLALPQFLLATARIGGTDLQGAGKLASVILTPLGLSAWIPGTVQLDVPTWSISAELFFYALLPILLPIALRRRYGMLLGCTGLWFGAMLLANLAWAHLGNGSLAIGKEVTYGFEVPEQFVKYFPPFRLPEFLAGIVLYVFWRRADRVVMPWILLACALVAGAGILTLRDNIPGLVMHNGLTDLAWLPLIFAVASVKRGPLTSGIAVYLGRISFALYLVHEPVQSALLSVDKRLLDYGLTRHNFLEPTLALAVSLGIAIAMYHFIEVPMRIQILKRWGNRAPRSKTIIGVGHA